MKTQKCKFCREYVDLREEGVQYRDGSCAHEECHDQDEFDRENAAEMEESY